VREVQAEQRERRAQQQREAAHHGLGDEELVLPPVRERADRRAGAVAERARRAAVVEAQRRARSEQRGQQACGQEQSGGDRDITPRGADRSCAHGSREGFPCYRPASGRS
jgi:hypothetical protein